MSLHARGDSGELRKGYQVVARVRAWSLDDTGRIDATASDVNTLWMEPGARVSVRLWFGTRFWAWREADVVQVAPLVLKVIGSPEVV